MSQARAISHTGVTRLSLKAQYIIRRMAWFDRTVRCMAASGAV
jgi:hypothetical protein